MANVNAQGTIWLPIEGTDDKIAAKAVVVMNPSGGEGGISENVSVTNFPAYATQTTLVEVLNKLTSDPATQTTLASIFTKLSNDPATQTTLAAINSYLPSKIGDRIPVLTTPIGLISPNIFSKSTTAEENLIASPGVGQKLLIHRVVAYNLSSTAEQTIILKSSDGSFPYPSMIIPAKDKDGFWDSSAPAFELAENTALRVSQSSATLVHYSVQYRVVGV